MTVHIAAPNTVWTKWRVYEADETGAETWHQEVETKTEAAQAYWARLRSKQEHKKRKIERDQMFARLQTEEHELESRLEEVRHELIQFYK